MSRVTPGSFCVGHIVRGGIDYVPFRVCHGEVGAVYCRFLYHRNVIGGGAEVVEKVLLGSGQFV
jgi:hypothetical protein